MSLWGDESSRRSLGIRERQILYDRAQHKCENCGRPIEFSDMQVGHKTAHSKGGGTTLRNSVALCYGCNKKQGTDNWEVFQRKQGKTIELDKRRDYLGDLTLPQLKHIATKHGVKLRGRSVEGGLFTNDYVASPSKSRYVKALAKVVTEEQARADLRTMPTPQKKKKRKSSDSWF